jgi:hypothetical protein
VPWVDVVDDRASTTDLIITITPSSGGSATGNSGNPICNASVFECAGDYAIHGYSLKVIYGCGVVFGYSVMDGYRKRTAR